MMCEIAIQVNCPYGCSSKVVKNVKKGNGSQNFLCKGCNNFFISICIKAVEGLAIKPGKLVYNRVHIDEVCPFINSKAKRMAVVCLKSEAK